MEPIETPLQDVYGWLSKRTSSLATHLSSKGLDLPDPECLRNCVRSSPSGPLLFLDEASSPTPEVDTQKMTATFVISTMAKDRVGDIVVPQGCLRFLPKNYQKNPRVFFSHKQHDLPIGSARNPDGTLAVDVQETFIRSTCYFHGETAESNLVFRMVARKELQASSIGFLPVKAAILNPTKEAERPETNEFGEDLIYFGDSSKWFPSLRFHEWDLTEWSIVPIPANAECISQHLSRGDIEGEKLTDLFRKSIEPWACPRKVWSPGALLLDPVEDSGLSKSEGETTPEVKTESLAGGNITVGGLGESPEISPVTTLEFKEDGKVLITTEEKTKEMEAPPVQTTPEDPQKGWPHGAKTLARALSSMDSHCSMIGECEPELDNPKVKSHLSKHKARIEKLVHKMKLLASKVYPDKFEDPGPAPAKSLPPTLLDIFPPAKEVPPPAPEVSNPTVPDLPWDEILSRLNTISSSQDSLSNNLFEINGKKI